MQKIGGANGKKPLHLGDYLPQTNGLGGPGKALWALVALAMGVAACGPSQSSTPQSPTLQQTQTPTQTYSIATSTATTTLIPLTSTVMPTYTSTATEEPILLGPLNPYLTGIGDHGAMLCLNPDRPQQLTDVVITANISQGDSILDSNIPSEKMGPEGTCFEVMDAKYQVGQPVTVQLNATGITQNVTNATQSAEIPHYGILDTEKGLWMPFPSMYPIFRQSEVSELPALIAKNHADPLYSKGFAFYAYDLKFGEHENKNVGVKIYAPNSVLINWVENPPDSIYWRIIATNPYTGYTCLFEHVKVTDNTAIPIFAGKSAANINFSDGWLIPYDSQVPLATISEPNNTTITKPHLHLECINPFHILKNPDPSKYVDGQYERWKGFLFARVINPMDINLLPSFDISPHLIAGWIQ